MHPSNPTVEPATSKPAEKMATLLEIAMVLLIGMAVIVLGIKLFGSGPVASICSVWAANLAALGAIDRRLRQRGEGWRHLGLRFGLPSTRDVVKAVLQSAPVFLAAIAAFIAAAVVMANIVGMPQPADMSKYAYLRGNLPMTLVALASVYCVSSFAEEVLYRGFLITRVRELFDEPRRASLIAVVISSLVFGLVHSDWGIAGMVQATAMGCALGVAFLVVKRNLWVTILAHAYMDTILVLQMYYAGA